MKKYILILSAFLVVGFKKTQAQQPNKTNVIWIITDEHNFRTLGCYRDQLSPDQAYVWGKEAVVETPNIDSLAEYGTIFNRMYCSAAVCTSSRASMFTGMYPMTLGIPNNSNKKGDGKYLKPDVVTIADVLSEEGYKTGYAGKWHLAESNGVNGNKDKDEWWSPYPVGDPEDTYGFQDKRYMFNGGHDKYKGIDADGNPYRAAKRPKLIGEDAYGQPLFADKRSKNVKHTTDWLADRAIEFIEDNHKQPFYYVVSIPDPHTPNEVRAPYDTLLDDVEVKLPETYHIAQKNKKHLQSWQKPDGKSDDQEKMKHDVRQYLGMVKLIDDNIGRIIAKLKEEGVFENTIIMFSSDHGDLLGEHGRSNKGTIHEASAKIPFVLAHGQNNKNPLIPRKKVVNLAANNTDWMPTFLSMLEIECPPVAGRDISPILQGDAPSDWNDVTFTRLGHYAAITERYKLHIMAKKKPFLFDIEKDPNEVVNYIDDPKYKSVIKKLCYELRNYMELSGDNNPKIENEIKTILSRL